MNNLDYLDKEQTSKGVKGMSVVTSESFYLSLPEMLDAVDEGGRPAVELPVHFYEHVTL